MTNNRNIITNKKASEHYSSTATSRQINNTKIINNTYFGWKVLSVPFKQLLINSYTKANSSGGTTKHKTKTTRNKNKE